MSEGQRGGEFFTPTALVKLIVEIIEPFHGRIFDPACGSGGIVCAERAFCSQPPAQPEHRKSPFMGRRRRWRPSISAR